MSVLQVLSPVAGVLVVALTLRDVFHTLFHPGGHGGLAALLCRGTWSALHRLGDRVAQLAGPGAVLLTILVWLGLVVAGFTLVLWPLVPDGLAYGQGSPYIRGFTGYLNVMMVDGIRLNNSVFRTGPNQYWATIDPLSLSRLEVVKGPGSVLYGTDAIGGAVNAITKSPTTYGEGV